MTFSRRIIAIIPAAGIGARMSADKPKQYLKIQDKTILEHTLSVFLRYHAVEKIIVPVASQDDYIYHLPIIKHRKITLVTGGETRSHSVLSGLCALNIDKKDINYKKTDHQKNEDNPYWVLVHDAARPILCPSDLDKLLQIEDHNGAILAIPVTDTIKKSNREQQIVGTEDRSNLWHALTPQFFPALLLKKALEYALEKKITVTDEASAMELLDYHPHLVAGHADNLKITRPEDLALAEYYLLRLQQKNDTTNHK